MTNRELFKAACLAEFVRRGITDPADMLDRVKRAEQKEIDYLVPQRGIFPAAAAAEMRKELNSWGKAFESAAEQNAKENRRESKEAGATSLLGKVVPWAIAVEIARRAAPWAAGAAVLSSDVRDAGAGVVRSLVESRPVGYAAGIAAGGGVGHYVAKHIARGLLTGGPGAIRATRDYELAAEYDRNRERLERSLEALKARE